MAIESQCRNCDKYQVDNGTCYDTRIEPNYNEETCLRFREIGSSAPALDTNKKHRLPGFLSFYLWCSLGVGSISKGIVILYGMFEKVGNWTWHGCADALFTFFTMVLSVYVIYAFVKRKRNAIALAKTQVIISFATTLITFLLQLTNSDILLVMRLRSIFSICWSVIFFWYFCTSDLVSRCIPSENRGLTQWDIVIITVVCSAYMWCVIVGGVLAAG